MWGQNLDLKVGCVREALEDGPKKGSGLYKPAAEP
jgi:hypothetical protein